MLKPKRISLRPLRQFSANSAIGFFPLPRNILEINTQPAALATHL
jgi:hypothetical protein